MAEITKIEWCDHTCNIWWGCKEVSPGCDNCYARMIDKRWGGDHWGNTVPRRMINSFFDKITLYQRKAEKEGVIKRVFVGSMMDIFEKPMPIIDKSGYVLPHHTTDTLRQEYFHDIIPVTPNLEHLLLSKRPINIPKYIPASWINNPPKNIMYGTSPVNQVTFDMLVKDLMQVEGRKFLSMEPMIGQIDILKELPTGKGQFAFGALMDWIIVGGESGPKKRPFQPEWARGIRDQCKEMSIPFFMKQIDKVQPIPEDLMIREFPAFAA